MVNIETNCQSIIIELNSYLCKQHSNLFDWSNQLN